MSTTAAEDPVVRRLDARTGYDEWAAIYDTEENPLVSLEQPLFDALVGDVGGLEILDVGCGTGRHSLRLAERGAQVHAVDFADQMLARARAKPGAGGVQFVVHDLAAPLPFPDERFDRVVCGLVVDHIADLPGLFREMRRVCRSGGTATISTMHPAMMLKGVQARFRDPATGQEVRPDSCPHQLSDYVTAALKSGWNIRHLSEHSVDEDLADRVERARKYLGWPLLFLMQLEK